MKDRSFSESKRAVIAAELAAVREDDEAAMSLGNIGAVALSVVGIIIAAVVSLVLLAELFPTYSGAVGNISDNFTTADWGDDTANSISPVFAMVVALGGLFAIVGLAFAAYKLRRG